MNALIIAENKALEIIKEHSDIIFSFNRFIADLTANDLAIKNYGFRRKVNSAKKGEQFICFLNQEELECLALIIGAYAGIKGLRGIKKNENWPMHMRILHNSIGVSIAERNPDLIQQLKKYPGWMIFIRSYKDKPAAYWSIETSVHYSKWKKEERIIHRSPNGRFIQKSHYAKKNHTLLDGADHVLDKMIYV